MSKYKVGDAVQVRKDIMDCHHNVGGCALTPHMRIMGGTKAIIQKVYGDVGAEAYNRYHLEGPNQVGDYSWTSKWLELDKCIIKQMEV